VRLAFSAASRAAQHEPAARHRIVANLDDRSVGTGAFEGVVLSGSLLEPAKLLLRINTRSVLAAFGEIADIIGIGPPLGEDCVGHVEHLLELAVPRYQTGSVVEHGNAVAHVLEGDAEFFLALLDFVEQSCILHRNYCLHGKAFQQSDLPVRKGP
jgi:hypothetical protein